MLIVHSCCRCKIANFIFMTFSKSALCSNLFYQAKRFASEKETREPDFELSVGSHSRRDKHLLIPMFPFAPLNTPLVVLNAACQDFQVFSPQSLQSVSISTGIQTCFSLQRCSGRKPDLFLFFHNVFLFFKRDTSTSLMNNISINNKKNDAFFLLYSLRNISAFSCF